MGQKAALALDGPEQMELNPDPEKTKASGGQKGLCPTPQKHIPSPWQASPIDIDATRSGFSIMYSPPQLSLVHRLANNGDVAGGQLAVFQGASEAPISESYGSSEQRGKTANWPRPRGLR